MGEDAARFRARHAPANHATPDNIALAVVFHNGFRYLPEANRHYMMRRDDAFDAILSPDQARIARPGHAGADQPGRRPPAPPGALPRPASPVRAEVDAGDRRKAAFRHAGRPWRRPRTLQCRARDNVGGTAVPLAPSVQ